MGCGVGHRRGSDLAMLCLWRRRAAVAPIRLGTSMCLEYSPKKKKERKKKEKKIGRIKE